MYAQIKHSFNSFHCRLCDLRWNIQKILQPYAKKTQPRISEQKYHNIIQNKNT